MNDDEQPGPSFPVAMPLGAKAALVRVVSTLVLLAVIAIPFMAAATEEVPEHEAAEAGAGAVLVFVLSVTLALVFSFLCSVCESVLLSVTRGDVEKLSKTGSRAGRILKNWKSDDIERPIGAILILNTLAHTVGAVLAGASFVAVFPKYVTIFHFPISTELIFSLLFVLAVLVLTEIIPKTLGVTFARRLAAPVTMFVWVLTVVFSLVLKATGALSRALIGEHSKPVTSIEEIRLLAALGHREGHVGARFASLIEGAASLRELTVHDVMVPRGSVVFLSGTNTLDENMEIIRHSGHSRFPFTPKGDIDEVDSVVLAKELLFHDHDSDDDGEIDWEKLKEPLVVVPESKPLDEVLRLFQEQRKHLAVVVDEYGGTQGVVTLEDVLEEIVGEIEDETDRPEKLIVKRRDGTLVCRGWSEMRKLFKVLDLEEKVDAVTVGGFVASQLGRVPASGDSVTWEGLKFTVTKASSRRAELVEVVEVPKGDEGDADA